MKGRGECPGFLLPGGGSVLSTRKRPEIFTGDIKGHSAVCPAAFRRRNFVVFVWEQHFFHVIIDIENKNYYNLYIKMHNYKHGRTQLKMTRCLKAGLSG